MKLTARFFRFTRGPVTPLLHVGGRSYAGENVGEPKEKKSGFKNDWFSACFGMYVAFNVCESSSDVK